MHQTDEVIREDLYRKHSCHTCIGNVIFCHACLPLLMNTFRYPSSIDSPPTLPHILKPICHVCTFFGKTSYTLQHISTFIACFMTCMYRCLPIPNCHLSGNVFQYNPRRKHMCNHQQRQCKWLHSRIVYCCCIH